MRLGVLPMIRRATCGIRGASTGRPASFDACDMACHLHTGVCYANSTLGMPVTPPGKYTVRMRWRPARIVAGAMGMLAHPPAHMRHEKEKQVRAPYQNIPCLNGCVRSGDIILQDVM